MKRNLANEFDNIENYQKENQSNQNGEIFDNMNVPLCNKLRPASDNLKQVFRETTTISKKETLENTFDNQDLNNVDNTIVSNTSNESNKIELEEDQFEIKTESPKQNKIKKNKIRTEEVSNSETFLGKKRRIKHPKFDEEELVTPNKVLIVSGETNMNEFIGQKTQIDLNGKILSIIKITSGTNI